MSLYPANPIKAIFSQGASINVLDDGVNSFTTAQDGQGMKITNNNTSGYLEVGSAGYKDIII